MSAQLKPLQNESDPIAQAYAALKTAHALAVEPRAEQEKYRRDIERAHQQLEDARATLAKHIADIDAAKASHVQAMHRWIVEGGALGRAPPIIIDGQLDQDYRASQNAVDGLQGAVRLLEISGEPSQQRLIAAAAAINAAIQTIELREGELIAQQILDHEATVVALREKLLGIIDEMHKPAQRMASPLINSSIVEQALARPSTLEPSRWGDMVLDRGPHLERIALEAKRWHQRRHQLANNDFE